MIDRDIPLWLAVPAGLLVLAFLAPWVPVYLLRALVDLKSIE